MRERNPVGVARFRATCCVGLVNTDPTPTRFRGTGRFAVFRFMLADRYATLVPNPWQLPNHISGGDSHALGVDSLARPSSGAFAIVLKRSGCRG